jgi:hypothetical protein
MLPLLATIVFTYWVQPCDPERASCAAGDEQLAVWALKAWEKASNGGLRLERSRLKQDALLKVTWESGQSGLYGEAVPIRMGDRVGAELHIRTNLRSLGPEMEKIGTQDRLFRDTIAYLTVLHESGHALGFPHTSTFADIMYSFQYGGDFTEYFQRYRRQLARRDDFATHSGLSASDIGRLQMQYPRTASPGATGKDKSGQ